MKTTIICRPTAQKVHNFYFMVNNQSYFMFNQSYRKGVQNYFGTLVFLEQAYDFLRSNKDTALIKTMNKLPMYINYIEKEYSIVVHKEII